MTLPPEESLAVLAQGSRSFSFAAQFLPRSRRLDAARVYAFCRLVDDIADDSPSDAAALAELARLEDELADPRRARPTVARFLETVARRAIELDHARELIEGVRSDRRRVRIRSDAELIRYGYRVAGTVGLLMCPVLGVEDARARPFAVDLGIAMQLTNICRDVLEDAALGRVYLPETRLDRAGVVAEDIVAGRAEAARLSRVVGDILRLADQFYRSAFSGFGYIPWRPRIAIVVASRVYRQIGLRLLACAQGNPLLGRTVVPAWEKAWVSLRALSALVSPVYWGVVRPEHNLALHDALRGLPGAHQAPLLPAKALSVNNIHALRARISDSTSHNHANR